MGRLKHSFRTISRLSPKHPDVAALAPVLAPGIPRQTSRHSIVVLATTLLPKRVTRHSISTGTRDTLPWPEQYKLVAGIALHIGPVLVAKKHTSKPDSAGRRLGASKNCH